MSSEDPESTHDPLADVQLFFLLGMGFQLIVAEFVDRLDEAGYTDLRPIHGLVFQALMNGGLTSTELGEQLGVTKQASGQIVEYLEGRGYVERRPHPEGGRRKLVVLTEQAAAHLGVAGQTLAALEAEIAAGLDDGELQRLRLSLARLVRQLAPDDIPPFRPAW
ncbi:MarR family transcriptional regulator [Patulibacter sp. NPDC049589]|uniref:MarR family winged helix-turn-helix transcriptional regulator n=1 Tax=Patulibacter sp. NPDC049589 TaxID=3154731 RepID=UPI0034492DA8